LSYVDFKRRGVLGVASAAAALAMVAAGASAAVAASGSGGVGPDEAGGSGSSSGVFPVRAKHSYGDGLGAGRGHQGQDIMAKCGKRVVAAQPGRVEYVDYQGSGAGNYAVIDGKGRLHDTVYMHLLRRAGVRRGQHVDAGDLIGRVGSTGRSTACHLHFEMWSGGWSAGKPINPTPYLKRWDRRS